MYGKESATHIPHSNYFLGLNPQKLLFDIIIMSFSSVFNLHSSIDFAEK